MRSIKNMILLMGIFLACLILYSQSSFANNNLGGFCGKETNSKMSDKLETEVKKGITVEVVGVLSLNNQFICKKSLFLSYDLWDEVVRLSLGQGTNKILKISELNEVICQISYCLPKDQKESDKLRYRILLNPLWEERVAKVLQLNPNIEKMKLIRLNAKSIANELPKDIVIYDKELRF